MGMMMQRNSTMRSFQSSAGGAQAEAQPISERPEDRFHTFAVYGAFAAHRSNRVRHAALSSLLIP